MGYKARFFIKFLGKWYKENAKSIIRDTHLTQSLSNNIHFIVKVKNLKYGGHNLLQ